MEYWYEHIVAVTLLVFSIITLIVMSIPSPPMSIKRKEPMTKMPTKRVRSNKKDTDK